MYLKPNRKGGQRTCGRWQIKKGEAINSVALPNWPQFKAKRHLRNPGRFMSLISTGGFSTSDASLGHWTQPAIHWVAVAIMILGSLPFTLYVATLRGHRRALLKDHQVRGFIGFLVFAWLAVGTWLCLHSDYGWWDAFRIVAVNVTSVVTTTGVAVGDYTVWGSFSVLLFFYLTFVGDCSGSTAGGLKIFRFQVAATLTFSFFFTITIAVIALGLSLIGLDWTTALSGAATAVCNVVPGLGTIIGPAGNFSSLPDAAK